ncbi:hypothetical protein Cni_G07438 [Canna indica]|uniref:Endonuclease/exonuclease/phosphatase domain-containing protein n=1 Tax=Canna indica TaxID=4628 RepID=A0AAQ3K243_9LILI|nr:hypothetical protein Cni_G07438 [Canna indica]
MKCISWNIRGALKKGALAFLWNMVKNNNVDLLILQETHLISSEADDFIFRYRRNWKGEFYQSTGRSGGIIILWRKSAMEIRCIHKNDQGINGVAKCTDGSVFIISGVYASTNYRKRKQLWDFLSEVNTEHIPWLIIGDMNCIREGNEKMGGREFNYNYAVSGCNTFIEEVGLWEDEFSGPQFTWTNNRKRAARIQARLDRVLYSGEWLDKNYVIKVKHLQRLEYDHRPLLVTCEKEGRKNNGEKYL